jgi:hypothetical protein
MGIPGYHRARSKGTNEGESAVKEPTDKELQWSLYIAWGLVALAIAAPVLGYFGPRPASMAGDLGGWFGRSGAVTTVFALLAETVLVRAKLSITPAGWGWVGLNEQREIFIPKFNRPELAIFWLVVIGTLIWAYGDLPFK